MSSGLISWRTIGDVTGKVCRLVLGGYLFYRGFSVLLAKAEMPTYEFQSCVLCGLAGVLFILRENWGKP